MPKASAGGQPREHGERKDDLDQFRGTDSANENGVRAAGSGWGAPDGTVRIWRAT
jgi:hypothetical protein